MAVGVSGMLRVVNHVRFRIFIGIIVFTSLLNMEDVVHFSSEFHYKIDTL